MIRFGSPLAVLIFGSLAAPATAQSTPFLVNDDLVRACVHETRAPGSYDWTQTEDLVEIRALQMGTLRGANDINDCLHDKFQIQYGAGLITSNTGSATKSAGVGCHKGAAFIVGGATYCIGKR